MPYDGSSNYTLPANTAAVSGATIQSTKFNSLTQDLESAINDLRYQNLNIIANLQTFLGSADLATARTNLGLGTGNSPQFTGIELGHASDTTLSRSAAGVLAVEGGAGSAYVAAIELGNASDTTVTRSAAGVLAVEGVTVPLNSITNVHTAQQIELGHASDTTLSRSSAGVLAVEGVTVPLNSTTNIHTAQQIELGHASDTTLSRLGAGDVGIEGQQIISTKALTITAANQAAARTNISASLKGHIFGLTLSNNATDATNDIDIAAGEAASTETDPVLMVLGSTLVKRLDANWAVGTNQGGLDTGAIANNTYHVWLIQRSDTGVVDALFSLSATAPTMPTNYDRKRRIGSIVRASGTIRGFKQVEDRFFLDTLISDYSSTSSRADSLITLSVPTGIVCRPLISNYLIKNGAASADIRVLVGSAVSGDADLGLNAVGDASFQKCYTHTSEVYTNTSAQIYFEVLIASGTLLECTLYTHGWIDNRGKDA